jgi:hypothetical protein
MEKTSKEEEEGSSKESSQNNRTRYDLPSLPSKINDIDIWILQSKVMLFGSTSIENENYGTSL